MKNNMLVRSISIMISAASLSFVTLMTHSTVAEAGVREQAKRMYDRLAGVPPTDAQLTSMVNYLNSNDYAGAANFAMLDPNFYNVTLKNMVIPWTNVDSTVFAPLNDTAATLIGLIRDNVDFREALYGNYLYVDKRATATPYHTFDNDMYVNLEQSNANLGDKAVLDNVGQGSAIPPAGVLTTRGSARAFFYAGTNRRMLRFTLKNYLCNDLEGFQDTSRVPDRIRQDVARSPGGDSSVFLNTCAGCHTGMDGVAGAFAYYEWGQMSPGTDGTPDPETGRLTYTGVGNNLHYQVNPTNPNDPFIDTPVQRKFLINNTVFPYGYVTVDDSWINYWRNGPNAKAGWGVPDPTTTTPIKNGNGTGDVIANTGKGMASLGYEFAHTEAFARCQVLKVYKTVCFTDPTANKLTTFVENFKTSGYKMKTIFADAATDCAGN